MKGCIVIFIVVLVSFSCFAQEKSEQREGHHEVHTNNFEVFNGVTFFEGTGLYTLGFDYEHRLGIANQHLGAGLLMDCEFGNSHHPSELLLTPTLFYFPHPHIKIFGGYGLASRNEEIRQEDNSSKSKRNTFGLLRVGVGYELDYGQYIVISPTAYIDKTQYYTAFVVGVAFGVGY